MVGVARRLARGEITEVESVRVRYDNLLKADAFISATETGTAHKESVDTRLSLATAAFADLK
jgi:hypothetical protein